MTVLSNISPEQVVAEPFPHVVVENAIAPELCRQLINEIPSVETFTKGQPYKSNHKIYMSGAKLDRYPAIPKVWKDFVNAHLQASLWHDLMRLFRPHLLKEYPDFERRFGKLDEIRMGAKEIDFFPDCDTLIDSKILIHTPVTEHRAIERGPHFKRLSALFFGYLYLRHDDDHSQGGDHVFYSMKPGLEPILGQRQTIALENLDVAKVIPYKQNTFVLFMNTPRTIQTLAARTTTNFPLIAHHITAYLNDSLFKLKTEPGVELFPVTEHAKPRRSWLRSIFAR